MPTPQGDSRWIPQPHQATYDFIVTALRKSGRCVEKHQLYLSRGDQRLIGLLHVDYEVVEGI